MAKQQAATMSYKREHGLTVEQQNAIDLLVQGKTDQEVASTVGVNRVTVTKWRLYDVWFQAELNRRRQDLWGTAAERLRAMLPKALAVLERRLDDYDHGLQAAVQVVKLVGLEKLGRPTGETDGDAIMDALARAKWEASASPDAKVMQALCGPWRATDAQREAVLAELETRMAEEPPAPVPAG